MSRRLLALAWLVVPTLVITTVTVAAAPSSEAAAAIDLDYVAMGDSYSAGVGTPPIDTCGRSLVSYPNLWANNNSTSSYRFVACTGAVTEDLLKIQLPSVDAGTDLISLSIGGNDVGFFPTVASCALDTEAVCEQRVTAARTAITQSLAAKLDNTYRAVRQKAPFAKIIVMGYPRLFDPLADCPDDGMSTFKRQILNAAADHLVRTVADRAQAAGFTFADVRGAFDGHAACTTSQWINPFSLDAMSGPLHPNAAGYSQGYLPAFRAAVAIAQPPTSPPPTTPPPTTPPPTTPPPTTPPPTTPPPTTPPPTTPPPSTTLAFGANEPWTFNPYFGNHAPGGAFADVTGDGRADAIVVNNNGVFVRRSTGVVFSNSTENWTGGAYFGERLTDFADVTGDGLADAIVVNNSGITVRRSNGSTFTNPLTWTTNPYFGDRLTDFADVNGDGRADAIAVNSNGVFVRISNGFTFDNPVNWSGGAFYGERQTSFADVTGDGRADAIVVNNNGITVRRSNGSTFTGPETWTLNPYFGERQTEFADVTGDGRADAVTINNTGILVRRSNSNGFNLAENWARQPYFGDRAPYTAISDVTGDRRADAIVVNSTGVTVRRVQ